MKRILQTNQRMKDELQLHMEETASLQRENGALAGENKRLAREVELRAQREAEFAKRGSKQARDVKETTAKVISACSLSILEGSQNPGEAKGGASKRETCKKGLRW